MKILPYVFGKGYRAQPAKFWKLFFLNKVKEALLPVRLFLEIAVPYLIVFWLPCFFYLHPEIFRGDQIEIKTDVVAKSVVVRSKTENINAFVFSDKKKDSEYIQAMENYLKDRWVTPDRYFSDSQSHSGSALSGTKGWMNTTYRASLFAACLPEFKLSFSPEKFRYDPWLDDSGFDFDTWINYNKVIAWYKSVATPTNRAVVFVLETSNVTVISTITNIIPMQISNVPVWWHNPYYHADAPYEDAMVGFDKGWVGAHLCLLILYVILAFISSLLLKWLRGNYTKTLKQFKQ